jgi:hypothetical protein
MESAGSAMAGAAGGIGLAWLVLERVEDALLALPLRVGVVEVDARVAATMVVIALIIAAVSALVPARFVTDVRLSHLLRGDALYAGVGRIALLNAFIAVQVCLTTVVLAVSGMLLDSLVRVSTVDLGFDGRNVTMARMVLSPGRYRAAEQRVHFHDALAERLRSLPGVLSVGSIDMPPLGRAS